MVTRRHRLGYFMYSPRLGGAERYLRDLLHGVGRDRFEVHLLAPPWPAFERFLGLDTAPPVERTLVTVLEPGSRLKARPEPASGTDGASFGTEAPPSLARRLSSNMPLGPRVAAVPQWALRQAYWSANVHRLQKALQPLGLDAFHAVNGGYPGATSARAAVVAARNCGIPARVLTVCSTPLPRRIVPAIERRFDREVGDAVTGVIVPARRLADALVELRGFPTGKVHPIPWGVVAPTPPADRNSGRRHAREQLCFPPDGPIVGTLGNFTPTKGHALVVEAIKSLRERGTPVTCVLAGSGPERAAVENRSRALGLADLIIFPGAIDDVFGFLRALDVFVLASDIEGLPLVVLEAMSQGVPVVATDVGGMPDAVVEGETGLLTPVGDADALASALDALIRGPDRTAEMGDMARVRFETNFTRETMLRRHEALYESILASGGPTPTPGSHR